MYNFLAKLSNLEKQSEKHHIFDSEEHTIVDKFEKLKPVFSVLPEVKINNENTNNTL